jgi:hypothetical protein
MARRWREALWSAATWRRFSSLAKPHNTRERRENILQQVATARVARNRFTDFIKRKSDFILLLRIKRKRAFILSMSQSVPERWMELLSDEDRTFVKRFILTSGSLKELAAAYGVTYPTVRLRLDRLIEKIKVFDKNDTADDYERLLRGLYAEGRFDASTFRQLLKHYQQE